MKSKRRGRKAKTPKTDLGLFIQYRLDAMEWTRAQFAKKLGVSPATIARMLNGDTHIIRSQQISLQTISETLSLNEIDRRRFLEIMSTASFAWTTGIKSTGISKYKIDLDLADDHSRTLQGWLDQGGDIHAALESAQRWYAALLREPSSANDKRFAATQLRFGLLLGGIQDLILPWYERHRGLQLYDTLEDTIICNFRLETFQESYAILLRRRAMAYRSLHNYSESNKNFDDACYWAKGIQSPGLQISLFSCSYNSAILGQETHWQRQQEQAYKDIQYLDKIYQEGAMAELKFLEAEGYKRLAYTSHKDLSRTTRISYAEKAIQSLQESRTLIQNHQKDFELVASFFDERTSERHYLLAQVSLAQYLILIDPREAIHLLQSLRDIVPIVYPSLVAKMERTLSLAQKQSLFYKDDHLFFLDLRDKFF